MPKDVDGFEIDFGLLFKTNAKEVRQELEQIDDKIDSVQKKAKKPIDIKVNTKEIKEAKKELAELTKERIRAEKQKEAAFKKSEDDYNVALGSYNQLGKRQDELKDRLLGLGVTLQDVSSIIRTAEQEAKKMFKETKRAASEAKKPRQRHTYTDEEREQKVSYQKSFVSEVQKQKKEYAKQKDNANFTQILKSAIKEAYDEMNTSSGDQVYAMRNRAKMYAAYETLNESGGNFGVDDVARNQRIFNGITRRINGITKEYHTAQNALEKMSSMVATAKPVKTKEDNKTTSTETTKSVVTSKTDTIEDQAKAMAEVGQAAQKAAEVVSKSQEEIREQIQNTSDVIRHVTADIERHNKLLDEASYKTSGKKAATEQLRDWHRKYEHALTHGYGERDRDEIAIGYYNAIEEAKSQGVAQRTLERYNDVKPSRYTEALINVTEFRDRLVESLDINKKNLAYLNDQLTSISQPQMNSIEQTTSAIESQTEAVDKNVKAWEKLVFTTNKAGEKLLKLTKVKNDTGHIIPETYTAVNGKYQIEKGTVGWNVYETDNYSELLYGGDGLREIQRDLGLATPKLYQEWLESQKADTQVITNSTSIEDQSKNVKNLTSSYEGLAEAVEKYIAINKKAIDAHESGSPDAKKLIDERNAVIGTIKNMFPQNTFDPSNSSDGVAMFLESRAASTYSPENILRYLENTFAQINEYEGLRLSKEKEITTELEKQSKLGYHAGVLSQRENTLKSLRLGTVTPTRDSMVFNGFTGTYLTNAPIRDFVGTEWAYSPISTIDKSKINMFKANNDELADRLRIFTEDLNAAIFGYYLNLEYDDLNGGYTEKDFNIKSVQELYSDLGQLFGNVQLSIEEFSEFITNSQKIVEGVEWKSLGYREINREVTKSGFEFIMQGVSRDIFNSDSFQTRLLKMLGYGGIDLDGSKYADAYHGGSVVFDVQPEHLVSVDEKWSDFMLRNGQEVTEEDLKYEEKRRELAFRTAKEYKTQEEALLGIEKEITVEKKTQADLVAMHGTSTENLIKTLKDGAFPSPSIAVTDPDIYSGGYGDATVVFKKSSIDPSTNPDNKIYGVDAYTPTYPRMGWELSEEGLAKAAERTGISVDSLRMACDSASESVQEIAGTLAYGAFDDELKEAFLRERNIQVKTGETDANTEISFHAIDEDDYSGVRDIIARDDFNFDDLVRNTEKQKEYFDALDQYVAMFEDFPGTYHKTQLRKSSELKDSIHKAASNQSIYEDLKQQFEHDASIARGENKVFDKIAYAAERSKIIGAHRQEYLNFVEGIVEDILVKPNVKGANGQRFERTPDGIEAAMSSYGGKAALYDSDPFLIRGRDEQEFILAAAKTYKNFDEVVADMERLQKDASGTHTRLESEYSIKAIASYIARDNNIDSNEAFDKIAKAVDGNYTAEAIGKALSESGLVVEPKTVSAITELAQEALKVPTRYFEAKPQRTLGIDDIEFVAVDSSAKNAAELKKILQEIGIGFVEHQSDDDASRVEALRTGMSQFGGISKTPTLYDTQSGQLALINGITESANEAVASVEKLDDSIDELKSGADILPGQIDFEHVPAQTEEIKSATNALEENTQAQKENNEVKKESVESIVPKKTIDSVLDGIDTVQFLKDFEIPTDKIDEGVDLFRDFAAEIVNAENGISSSRDTFGELFDFIKNNSVHFENVEQTMEEFYNYMKGVQIRIPESMESSFEGDFKDQWKNIKRRRAINSKQRLITSTSRHASSPDQLYQELIENGYGYALDVSDEDDVLAPQDALRVILNAVEKAKREVEGPKRKKIVGLDDDSQQHLADRLVNDVVMKMTSNLNKLNAPAQDTTVGQSALAEQADRVSHALDEEANSAARASGAIRDLGNASENINDGINSNEQSEEEAPSIFKIDEDEALAQLREAIDNKTRLIDLSKVFTTEDLDDELQHMVSDILGSQTDLTFGNVVVQDDIARLQLYNKELGVTIGQVYQLQETEKDSGEYVLKHLPEMDTYRHDAKAAKAWSEAQAKKQAQSDAWLLNRLSELKTQERKSKQSNKKISGDTLLENVDDTTLVGQADVTIDKLAESIRERIKSSLGTVVDDATKNQIKQDINALSDEIKVAQYKQYATTTMKPTELAEARKNLENMLNTAESKARKNNVFTQMKDDFDALRKSLTDEEYEGYIKDATGLGEFVDRFRTTKSKLGYEISQSQEMKNLLTLQEKLYDAKKKSAELDAKGESDTSDGLKASRKAEELQEQYDIALKLLASDENRNKLLERQAKLKKELDAFTSEQGQETMTTDSDDQSDKIKKYYDDYLSLIQQLNNVNQQLYSYQGKNQTGAYSGLIEQLQEQKFRIIEQIKDINQAVDQNILNIDMSDGGDKYRFDLSKYFDAEQADIIKEFFNNVNVEAALGAESIQKFIDVAMQSQKIDASFAEGVGKQFTSISNLHDKIKDVNVDDTTKANAELLYNEIQKGLATKLVSGTSWAAEQESALQSLIEKYTEYASTLDKIAQKQKEYFQGKTEYKGGSFDDVGTLVPWKDGVTNKADDTKSKLEAEVKEFSKGEAIITGFKKSADGISRMDFSIFDKGANQIRTFTMEMGSVSDTIYKTETTFDGLVSGTEKAMKSLEKVTNILRDLQNAGADMGSDQIQKLIELQKKLSTGLNGTNIDNQSNLSNIAREANISVQALEKLLKKQMQIQQLLNSDDVEDLGVIDKDGKIYDKMRESVKRYAEGCADSALQIGRFNEKTNELKFTMISADGTVKEMTASMDVLTGQCIAQETGVKQVGTAWDRFISSISKSLQPIAGYLKNTFDIYMIVQQVRQGVSVVREIDSAMTELKKVTDETDTVYDNFLDSAQGKAGKIGTTMKEFIETTSDFARLGYSIEEATSLSEAANVYKNVGDGMSDVSEASESIISTMKAFGMESSETMSIVDKFNEVSNNFAISSSGIGEALQRSAAALAEAGNSLDESIALITAANNVVQNPEVVGTAFRTLALRLRGAKVELQEAGEDVDGMAESTSQLREKLLALTGGKVDIMIDEDTFKNTTQILREMSAVWDEMSDIDAAAALELMGGKRQANTLSTVIRNFDIVEDAINKAQNSMGSAEQENAKYMESIQGRINLFNKALQAMWSNELDAGMIKWFVDLGTALVGVVDTLGLIPSLLLSIAAVNLAKNFIPLGVALLQIKLAEEGLISVQLGQAAATKLQESANIGAISSFKALGKAAKATWGAIAKHPFIALAAVAIAAITAITVGIKQAEKEAAELAQSQAKELEEERVSIAKYKSQIDSLRASLDSGNLSEEEAYNVRKQLMSIQDELIAKYGKEAEGINLVTGAIENQKAALDGLAKKNAEDWLKKNNEKTGWWIFKFGKSPIDQAIETMTEEVSSSFNNYGTTSTKDKFKDAFGADWEAHYNEWREGFVEVIESLDGEVGTNDGFNFGNITREKLQENVDEVIDYINNYVASTGNKVNLGELIGEISSKENEIVGSDYNTQRANLDAYLENTAIVSYTNQYSEILDAKEKFEEAYRTGDYDAIEAANDKLTSAIETAKNATEDPLQKKWFDGLDDEYDTVMNNIIAKHDFEKDSDGIYAGIKGAIEKANGKLQNDIADIDLINLEGFVTKNVDDKGTKDDFSDDTLTFNWDEGAEDVLPEQKAAYEAVAAAAHKYGMEVKDVIALLVQMGVVQGSVFSKEPQAEIPSFQSYSSIEASLNSLNEAMSGYEELVIDGVKTNADYYDSLIELGIAESELSECIDKNSGYVVTNSKGLKKLLQQQRQSIAANNKLAKSQARLEYYDLVKKLNNTLNGTKILDGETKDLIHTTLEQIDAVQRAIYQYQLLEDQLLGTSNAFEEFEQAKEIDALNTYGDSYVEMVQTIYDAFYKTGQVGTEQFWTAVEHLVPDSVYQSLKEDADKMEAIFKYFNEVITPSGTLENDTFSLGFENIEDFVNKALDSGVFKGNTEKFDLVEGMNLEKASELLGITKTQAYALFAELDKYNTSRGENSFLAQLDGSLEGRITNITNEVEELNRQKLALLEDGGYEKNKNAIDEINQKLSQSQTELNKLGSKAYTTWQEYTKNDAALAALGLIEDKQRKLTKEEANMLGIEWDKAKEQTVQQAYDNLLAKQLQLEEPTVLTAQLAIENINSQIAELDAILQDPKKLEIEAKSSGKSIEMVKADIEKQIQALKEDKAALVMEFGIELSEEDKATIQQELDRVEKFIIHDKEFQIILNGLSEVMAGLQEAYSFAQDKTVTITTKFVSSGGGSGDRYRPPNYQAPPLVMANGNAHFNGGAFSGGSIGAPRTETALVGELGPEMLVRNGRWTTIGENGAEFTGIKKGDIIFNHKQTESLLKNGYVTGRGKAYASGTAYSGLWTPSGSDSSSSSNSGSGSGSSSSSDDAKEEFEELFDWIEVRLEEINEDLDLMSAKRENAIGYSVQNDIVDDMIATNQKLYENLIAASSQYYSKANSLLHKIPAEYHKAIKDGLISIETFAGEADEKTLEAIQEYRDLVQKAADATQQAEEALTEMSKLAKAAIDNVAADYENKASIGEGKIEQLEAYNALNETDLGAESANIYKEMIKENNSNIEILEQQRDAMQAALDKYVESGKIKKYSQDWYDAVNDIAAVDTKIIELTTDTENYQDAINELHWDHFDNLMSQYEAISDEASNLIDILSTDDVADETGKWTDEGITSLGLYAQQMEVAEMQASKYKEEIDYLNKNWKKLGYTEQEYVEKLEELKSGQYDAIKAYNDTKDAIVDLNRERVDAIKEGIEKEIEAYEELINKKKEELDAEKDLYDFQKGVADQQKEIADIERKLAALSADNSASARAKRAQLEADLLEAKAELEETYYDRSISDQQTALDKELENFNNEKDQEIEKLETYLEETNQVVADSLATVQANTDVVYQTLKDMGKEYSLSITESLTSPWKDGSDAIQSFSEKFGLSMSSTVEELQKLADEYKDVMAQIEGYGSKVVYDTYNKSNTYQNAEDKSGKTPKIKVGGKINASGAKIYDYVGDESGEKQYYSSDPIYKVLTVKGDWVQVRHHSLKSGVTGWFKKNQVKAYAKGTNSVDEDQLALIDELGDELVIRPSGGRLTFLEKGSGVIPANLTANLMEWGALDPSSMLEQNKPVISAPHITNNESVINIEYGDILHIDNFNGDKPEDLSKMIDKAFDKHMKNLNQQIRRYTR